MDKALFLLLVNRYGLEDRYKKIEIIVELQKAVAEIRKDARHVIWKI